MSKLIRLYFKYVQFILSIILQQRSKTSLPPQLLGDIPELQNMGTWAIFNISQNVPMHFAHHSGDLCFLSFLDEKTPGSFHWNFLKGSQETIAQGEAACEGNCSLKSQPCGEIFSQHWRKTQRALPPHTSILAFSTTGTVGRPRSQVGACNVSPCGWPELALRRAGQPCSSFHMDKWEWDVRSFRPSVLPAAQLKASPSESQIGLLIPIFSETR